MPNRNWFRLTMLLVFSIALLSGCGDGRAKRVSVSGTVTIDGTPLAFGTVTFMPDSTASRAGGGSLDKNGVFQVSSFTPNDGLMPGKYSVMILAIEPINQTSQRWHAPKKYSVTKTSGLTCEINEAIDDLNFELSWEDEDPSEPFVEEF